MAKWLFRTACVITLSIHLVRFAEALSSAKISPDSISIPSSTRATRTTRKSLLGSESPLTVSTENDELTKKNVGPYPEAALGAPPARSLTAENRPEKPLGRRTPPVRLRADPMPPEYEEFFDASENFESPWWYRSMSSSVSSIFGRLVHWRNSDKSSTDLKDLPQMMKSASTQSSSQKLEQTAQSGLYHQPVTHAISKADAEELRPSASSPTKISKADLTNQQPTTSSSTKNFKADVKDRQPMTSSSTMSSKSDVKDLQPPKSSSTKTPPANVGHLNLATSTSAKNPPDDLRLLVNDLLTDFMQKHISPDQSARAVDGAFQKSNRVTQWASRQVPNSVWHWLLTSKILPRVTDRFAAWLVGSLKDNLGNEKVIAAVQDQLQELHRATHQV